MPDTSRDIPASTTAPCELTVLMHCLNEPETIGICVKKAKNFIHSRNIDGEVLVADNGSTDGSGEIAEPQGARVVPVAPMEHAQGVKRIVERLKLEGSQQHVSHVRVFRPWGSNQGLDAGNGFQIKHLSVKPGAKPSPQRHYRRAEHWVVVHGTARVTRGEEAFDLQANESTYIPLGADHRLENPGSEPLSVIEIQSGDYLGEDDIERFDNVYGRANDYLANIRMSLPENHE